MATGLRIALYQPDIAGNTGTLMRLSACLGVGLDIIGPAGFDLSDRALRRAGMDYLEMAAVTRHVDYVAFAAWRRQEARRLVLFTTGAGTPYTDFAFRDGDILLFGRESGGVPDHVHHDADARLVIPMQPAARSLNLALSAAMGIGEAIRQVGVSAQFQGD
jgi:tRNA (cytidine/uridine-2'-O-)-methyltransferase